MQGLPTSQGYKNIHVEDLVMAKDNDNSILVAVDVICIYECLEDKFCHTELWDIFLIRLFGTNGRYMDVITIKNMFYRVDEYPPGRHNLLM